MFTKLLAAGLLFSSAVLHAQTPQAQALEPVKWAITSSQVEGGDWEVAFKGTIDEGWYVYSQETFGEMGPIPTTFAFDTVASLQMVGKTTETGAKMLFAHDDMFDMKVRKYKGHVLFTQRIRTAEPGRPITGWFEFQTCDDSRCLPPEQVFFKLDLAQGAAEMGGLAFARAEGTDPGGILEPVTWALRAEKKGGGLWTLHFDAKVQDGWYVYSSRSFGDGPIPTSFALDSAAKATLIGEPHESGPEMVEGMDDMFGITVRKFKHTASFTVDVRAEQEEGLLKGVVNYMTCDDSKCIFPDPLRFQVDLATGSASVGDAAGHVPAGADACALKLTKVDLANPVLRATEGDGKTDEGRNGALWYIFMLGFGGGLVALLTPCVFPMIPLTVSFFTKGSEDKAKGKRNAFTYGAFIVGIYLLFSLPFHLLGSVNPEIFNEISTNPWLNVFFFVVFLVFAVSFFGYFEITLPSSWVNRMDSNASKFGGTIGIFFMALTLALVSFSCTGPILGSLLAGALTAEGGAWQLTAGLGGFGLALALPFALFALFPGWLNSLPRSGSWLNSVKVVLGFAEVALAFKFLSNADLVKHWGLIPYELFMVVWVLCGLGIVLYLLGVIRFPHDSPVKGIAPLRWGFIAVFSAATIYMVTGFRYNEETKTFTTLKLMSGLAPPVGYSWIYPKDCPSNFDCYHDLDAGLAQSKATGKPLLIDFTGYACVNCRKMEEHVWPVAEVQKLIDKEYILVSLYVDDKSELPTTEQRDYTTCTGKQKRLVTKGNKWSTLQTETFINNSQPYYALLSPAGELLTDPVGYTPDKGEYRAFLQRGLEAMRTLDQQASR